MHFEIGRVGFEKLSEMDYRGNTYYTIRNLSLYECQGWCREEPDCAAASFRFVSFWHSRMTDDWTVVEKAQSRDKEAKLQSRQQLMIIIPPFLFSLPSFVVNPLAPIQETVCLLQNETTGSNPTVNPQKAVSTYYMIKLNIRSGT